jgi:hypothetical protein
MFRGVLASRAGEGQAGLLARRIWLVDSFLNEGDQGVKVRFRVVDFNLLCGIEGVAFINQQTP